MKFAVIAAIGVSVLASSAFAASAPAAAAGAAAAKPNTRTFDPHDLAGVWTHSSRAVFNWSLNEKYAAILKKRRDDEAAGRPLLKANSCSPAPLIEMMTRPVGPLEFAPIHDDRLVISKSNGSIYRVYFKRPHPAPEDVEPSLFGDAVGHWEGDTLVIDTVGLGGTDFTDGQIPHSPVMHVVQRLRRTAFDKLENRITVEDAEAFTRPATAVQIYTLTPDEELNEFYCTNDRIVYDSNGKVSIAPPH
ncbi:MAG TPA: hypothetical protein VL358_02065 [Caulobacteraceae bacterium]|jgi:hypothetical protein|nr:hypothetical protein [Caulobacteraceae bacterium]